MRIRIMGSILVLLVTPWLVLAQTAKPLPQTYVSDDERLTLRYPAGWVLDSETSGQLIVATDESLFELSEDIVPSGQAAFGVLFLDENSLGSLIDLGGDPLSIMEAVVKTTFESADAGVKLESPIALTFADHPAARTDGTFIGNDIFLMVVDQGGKHYALYIGITAGGEMPKYEPKLLAIGESIHYLPSGSE